MKKLSFITILTLAVFILAACSSVATTEAVPTQPAVSVDATDESYPAPELFDPGYPVSSDAAELFEQSLTPNAPAPEFSSDTGAVTIILRYPDGERPVRGQLFFAAGTLPVEGVDDGFIPVLDAEMDPNGHSDAQGVLVISNMQPGKYALTLMTPLGPILVEDADNGDAIIIEITAGEVLDLGTVSVFLNSDTLEP